MTANARKIRPATPADHTAFERLFPELEVEDPPVSLENFVRVMMPTTLIAVAGEGAPDADRAVGYAYFQLIDGRAYVRHLVTAPEARRTGVGRALLAAIVERGHAAACTDWCLNVKRENTAAIALYERLGMTRAFDSKALRLEWARVQDVQNTRTTTRSIEPEDDARVETALGLMKGQLAMARRAGDRVLLALFDGEDVVAGAVFDPAFPGAYPFRAARPDLAFALLRALEPHARPNASFIKVVCEGQPAIADALIAAGATVVHDIVHMKAALPALSAIAPSTPGH
jgi:ribosomal protein S18 acetylase RimI-like enzyme